MIPSRIPAQLVCRTALLKHQWWLITKCCNWGWVQTWDRLKRWSCGESRKRKIVWEQNCKAEGRCSLEESQNNCLSIYFLLTWSLSEQILSFLFQTYWKLNLPFSSYSHWLTGCLLKPPVVDYCIITTSLQCVHFSCISVPAVVWSLASFTFTSFP